MMATIAKITTRRRIITIGTTIATVLLPRWAVSVPEGVTVVLVVEVVSGVSVSVVDSVVGTVS